MVISDKWTAILALLFQYSLCRVVLMVRSQESLTWLVTSLSVLALSSRFDGQGYPVGDGDTLQLLSVLALSSRFDGH